MTDDSKKWGIIGNGSFAETLYEVIINEHQRKAELFVGFIEIYPDSNGGELYLANQSENGKRERVSPKVIGSVDCYLSIGYSEMNKNREKIFNYLSNKSNLNIKTFISKDIAIYKSIKIGLGSVIFPGSIVEPHSTIGNGSVLWFGSHVCHHTNIGDFVWVAAKTTIGAQCTVKDKCFFGVSCTVPSNSTIDAKTLVTSGTTTPTKTYPGCVVGQKGVLTLTNDGGASSMVESDEFIRFM